MITVLKGGCGTRHPITFIMSRPEGLNNHLLLIVRSNSIFTIENKGYEVHEGSAIIIAPHTAYSYYNPHGNYRDDWLHFQFREPSAIPRGIPPFNEPFPIGDSGIYTTYLQQILWETIYNPSSCSKENVDGLFHILLNHLSTAYKNKYAALPVRSHIDKLQKIRLHIQNTITERHSVKDTARSANLSESYFQYLYKSCFQRSFQKDVIQMRIDYAKHIINTTDLPIEHISEMCGYSNTVHFYRQFKKHTAMTPAKYRIFLKKKKNNAMIYP